MFENKTNIKIFYSFVFIV